MLAKRGLTIQSQAFLEPRWAEASYNSTEDWKFLDSTQINWILACTSLLRMTFFEESPVSERVWESSPRPQ